MQAITECWLPERPHSSVPALPVSRSPLNQGVAEKGPVDVSRGTSGSTDRLVCAILANVVP